MSASSSWNPVELKKVLRRGMCGPYQHLIPEDILQTIPNHLDDEQIAMINIARESYAAIPIYEDLEEIKKNLTDIMHDLFDEIYMCNGNTGSEVCYNAGIKHKEIINYLTDLSKKCQEIDNNYLHCLEMLKKYKPVTG
jgi:hypothetical protein